MGTVKAVVDVHYRRDTAVAACVLFDSWVDSEPLDLLRVAVSGAAPYRAGRFAERELPCLLAVLREVEHELDAVVVDGFVHLRTGQGLGACLHDALERHPAVIGVAKRPLELACRFAEITRGRSVRPLFVSAVECPLDVAARTIRGMHGPYRLPTLLRLADRHARGA
jgi:deoxyribonuclease V